jgi:hypothetical protein
MDYEQAWKLFSQAYHCCRVSSQFLTKKTIKYANILMQKIAFVDERNSHICCQLLKKMDPA